MSRVASESQEDLGTMFTNYRAGSATILGSSNSRRQSSITSLNHQRARSLGNYIQRKQKRHRDSFKENQLE